MRSRAIDTSMLPRTPPTLPSAVRGRRPIRRAARDEMLHLAARSRAGRVSSPQSVALTSRHCSARQLPRAGKVDDFQRRRLACARTRQPPQPARSAGARAFVKGGLSVAAAAGPSMSATSGLRKGAGVGGDGRTVPAMDQGGAIEHVPPAAYATWAASACGRARLDKFARKSARFRRVQLRRSPNSFPISSIGHVDHLAHRLGAQWSSRVGMAASHGGCRRKPTTDRSRGIFEAGTPGAGRIH